MSLLGTTLVTTAGKIITTTGTIFRKLSNSQTSGEDAVNYILAMIVTSPITLPLIGVGLLLEFGNPSRHKEDRDLD